ncbi:MAG TPA: hypothetical protein VGL70_14335 [Candidatus Binatia bacterium]
MAILAMVMGLLSLLLYIKLRMKCFLYFFIGVLLAVSAAMSSLTSPYDIAAIVISLLLMGWSVTRVMTVDHYHINPLKVLLSRDATNAALSVISQGPPVPPLKEIVSSSVIFFLLGCTILYFKPAMHPVVAYAPFVFGIELLAGYFVFYALNRQ